MGEEGRVVEKVADKTVESHGEKVPDGKPPVHIGRCEYETTQMPTGPPKRPLPTSLSFHAAPQPELRLRSFATRYFGTVFKLTMLMY